MTWTSTEIWLTAALVLSLFLNCFLVLVLRERDIRADYQHSEDV